METSLAADEQEQQHRATLSADRFFFMSPFRSFTTSGCFQRFTCPAEGGDAPDSAFQQGLASAFAAAKAAGIANPVMVGAIPFDTRQPSALFIPERSEPFSRTAKQHTSRYHASREPMGVTARQLAEQMIEAVLSETGITATAGMQCSRKRVFPSRSTILQHRTILEILTLLNALQMSIICRCRRQRICSRPSVRMRTPKFCPAKSANAKPAKISC